MFSKTVTSYRLLCCAVCLCAAFAVGQSVTSTPRVPRFAAPSSQVRRSQSAAMRHGSVTPADLALKNMQPKLSKSHSFGAGSSLLSNSIFLGALDFNSAGAGTHSVAAGDLNGDGKIDLVLADECANNSNCNNGSVSVLLGNGDGSFQTAVSYASGGENALSVAIADVNNDGKMDVIVTNNCDTNNCANGIIGVLLGNGDGTLQAPVSYSSGGQQSQYTAIADVNGDGKPDLLVASECVSNNCSNGLASVLLGNGDGTFQTAVSYNAGGINAAFVAVQDVNGDGKPDMIVANNCADNNCSNGSASVLLGNGDGTFQTAVSYNSGGLDAFSVAIADVNGDGKPDAIVTNICLSNSDCSHGLVSVLLGNGDGTFQTAVSYSSGGEYPESVAAVDINGDGKADLVVANETARDGNWADGGVASVLLGNGDGTFQPAVSYASGDFNGTSVVVADVDGDGRADVVMASGCVDNYSCVTGGVSVFLSNGDGTLRGAVEYDSDAWTSYSVATADVDGDGKLDLLVTSQCNSQGSCSNGSVSVLLGNGNGTFQPAVAYNSGGLYAFSIVSADVNGDGKLDLLVGNSCADNNCTTGSVSVLLGNGDGTFQTAVSYGTAGINSYSLAIGDVNGDGKQDLMVANQCDSNSCSNAVVSVLLGNGDGTFQTAVPYNPGGLNAFSVAVADVNGDGKADLLVASQCADNNCTNGTIGVLLGNGDGTFQTAVDYSSGGLYAFSVAVADLNGDGKLDLIATNQCGNSNNCTNGSVAVLLGNGDGTFQTASTFVTPVLGNIQSIVLADFNGDHKLDLASGVGNMLLLGNGDGTFQSPIALGASGSGIAAGDFNGDGRPDLAVGGVSVLLNISGGFVFPTSTAVTSSLNPSNQGQSVTFTATVTPQTTGIPTGTVTFSDGSTTLGQATLTNGTASYSTAALSSGSHSITASYSGDSSFTASVSTALNQVVNAVTAAGFSISSSALSPSSVVAGGSAQSTITITPVGGLNPSTVSVTCSVVPVVSPAATCSLGAVSVSGGNGSATLTVGTTGPQAALAPQSAGTSSGKLLALALLIPGLALCGAGVGGSNRRKLLAIAIVFLALTGCMLQTACSGVSSSSGTHNAGTPAGTYTVTVTGSAGGTQHTAAVSLTVQ